MPKYNADSFDPPAPVARVVLRHPKGGTAVHGVPMLIDSGADATLVPEKCVQEIRPDIDSEKRYELMSFDGSTSSAAAVELDMIFLKRAFRGRYLLIDQDIGIMGRDVLNHVSLLLDGPDSSWMEHQGSG